LTEAHSFCRLATYLATHEGRTRAIRGQSKRCTVVYVPEETWPEKLSKTYNIKYLHSKIPLARGKANGLKPVDSVDNSESELKSDVTGLRRQTKPPQNPHLSSP
jgi:hypothetical protein